MAEVALIRHHWVFNIKECVLDALDKMKKSLCFFFFILNEVSEKILFSMLTTEIRQWIPV